MPSAAVYDCEGARLSDDERAFFRDADPWGFIIFARHCETPEAVRVHCEELRDCVGREAPILIDQEGGRVARMRPPGFPAHAAPGKFGELWRLDRDKARAAARLNAMLLARMVSDLGVTVNCVPSLDAPQIDADPATLGDRALAMHVGTIADLGRAVIEGTLEGGAIPVVKHMPGLGRALCDSHLALPRVGASRDDLAEDFAPFRALNDAPAGMTAHAVYEAFDPDRPATQSPVVIRDVIRGEIGFDGLLFTDDLKMEALAGDYDERARASLEAGCDIALVCNLPLADKKKTAGGVGSLEGTSKARAERAIAARKAVDRAELAASYAELEALLKPVLA